MFVRRDCVEPVWAAPFVGRVGTLIRPRAGIWGQVSVFLVCLSVSLSVCLSQSVCLSVVSTCFCVCSFVCLLVYARVLACTGDASTAQKRPLAHVAIGIACGALQESIHLPGYVLIWLRVKKLELAMRLCGPLPALRGRLV